MQLHSRTCAHSHTTCIYTPTWPQIVRWFAERVDMIILLFDPYKLDISDELSAVIKILKGLGFDSILIFTAGVQAKARARARAKSGLGS